MCSFTSNLSHCKLKFMKETLRNNSYFDDEISNIHPKELQLKKMTEASTKLSYVDIMIEIADSCLRTDVYNKRWFCVS